MSVWGCKCGNGYFEWIYISLSAKCSFYTSSFISIKFFNVCKTLQLFLRRYWKHYCACFTLACFFFFWRFASQKWLHSYVCMHVPICLYVCLPGTLKSWSNWTWSCGNFLHIVNTLYVTLFDELRQFFWNMWRYNKLQYISQRLFYRIMNRLQKFSAKGSIHKNSTK